MTIYSPGGKMNYEFSKDTRRNIINYAVQALAGKDIVLVPVPAGTGSDLSRTIGRVNIKEIL